MTNAEGKESGISLPFLSLSFVLLSWTSFQAGKVTREYIDLAHNVPYSRENLEAVVSRAHTVESEGLPSIWTISEREIPLSVTSEEYDNETDGDEKYEHEDVSLLSFRQLFLDLDGVAAQWIQSDLELQARMKQIAEEYDSHLIAQGCHQDTSGFITCLGTFEDAGHIAIHAWPQRGVVLFDILASDSQLIDNVEAFCDIFHADMPKIFDPFLSVEDPRGPPTWHTRSRASIQCSSDYEGEIGINGETKFMVTSLKTGFQQVDVVDIQVLRDRVDLYEFQQKDPAYIKAHPEFFQPDRSLFLDGVVQSTLCGDAPYHEALVQPSMFAHPNPKRVAIIGGGEGATLREVLKHNTVEKVMMIEIDPGVIEVSKAYLPSWNDCSNYEGSNRYCMDDPRAEIHTEDALKWFIDRYLGIDGTNKDAPLFDVIIMDALDPQDVVKFAKALYGDSSFLGALYAALSENGILITQVGDAPGRGDAPEHLGEDGNRVVYATSLVSIGFKSIVDYSEDHTGFEEPWYFYAAFKDLSTKGQWMATEAEINLKMQKRSIHTLDGRSPFVYFDGATMNAYRYPTQASVDVFCLREPTPPGCKDHVHGFDPNVKNFRADKFNGTTTNTGASDGRGIVAKVDVPLNSFLTLEQTVYPIIIEPSAGELIERMSYHAIGDEHNLRTVRAFARRYGDHCRRFEDPYTTHVQTGIMAFARHGCIALSDVGLFQNNTDNGVDSKCRLDEFGYYRNQGNGTVFNPIIMRDTTSTVEHTNIWSNIIAGEEIFKHYCQEFSGAMEWAIPVRTLRGHCLGGVSGKVEQYREEGSIQGDGEKSLLDATFSHYQTMLEISSTGPVAKA